MKLFCRYKYLVIVFLIAISSISSCTEPFEAPTKDFEDILVVDAFITSEEKLQEINLSRTFVFDSPVEEERNAIVRVSGNDR
ncbi:DUF4249 family protein [Flagellimonas sp. 389]|uniref:DUF4249 family protein n=1 Tax=Flagellimonas sp. 389 TaxID=2835862 RepID=UPI001BD3A3E0|nr:DUF4249 family protein [Flagellimonas sp. 389]MBS9463467.1 DUF4249 family protein [Flagellimonas sp. 389]